MARSTHPSAAQQLRLLAAQIHAVADHFDVPSETTTRAEQLIHHVEELAAGVRAVVRGRG